MVEVWFALGSVGDAEACSVVATVQRRKTNKAIDRASEFRRLDGTELSLCRSIARRASEILKFKQPDSGAVTLAALRSGFDEHVIAGHLRVANKLSFDPGRLLRALHELSEQSYENKSLTLGCVLDPHSHVKVAGLAFADALMESKKYKALTDGYRTAYRVSRNGAAAGLIDLEEEAPADGAISGRYFPYWSRYASLAAEDGRAVMCLTRQGDLLVFAGGSLRFSYRFGRWQYWHHAHLLELLRKLLRGRRLPKARATLLARHVYRAALDVSFRRSGGLLLVLTDARSISKVVKVFDRVNGKRRAATDRLLDDCLPAKTLQGTPRSLVAEMAGLDGAIVLDKMGRILAFGAVVDPRRKGKLRPAEGSRTKAAQAGSRYGVAVKVSSDGDVSVYESGREFLRL